MAKKTTTKKTKAPPKKSPAKRVVKKERAAPKKAAAKKSPSPVRPSKVPARAALKKAPARPVKKAMAPRPVAAAPKQVPVKPPQAPAKPPQAPAVAKPEERHPPEIRPPLPKVEPSHPAPAVRPKAKMLSREFMVELAGAIKAAIAPLTREARGREVVGTAMSGDATFELDRVAEKALLSFLKNARMPVAYYSEDSGYTTFTNAQPQNLLIIDPIDGTRAAKSGFESCVISAASTRIIERPCMADVDNACIMEILGDRVFYAERGKGARITQGEHVRRPKLSRNIHLELISWSMTVPGRPAELIFPTAARLIDLSSLKGGFFACNSTSFSLTRLLTNQLDACADFANRYFRDIPHLVKDQFINAGRGIVIGVEPYDLAAALLIVQEGGCVVTDAYGKSLDEVLLLDTSVENHRSIIAAANAELHEKLLRFFDMRINQWEQLLQRRADRAAAQAQAAAAR
jgi:myo-inositol-1(or 4)-monophosphatase